MLIAIPDVLGAAQLSEVRTLTDGADWIDGNATSGTQSALAKRNRQLPEESDAARKAGAIVLDALAASPLFVAAALPLKVFPPLFNRYEGGEAFGRHVDSAVRIRRGSDFRIRSDLSATLFLDDPEGYDGGELVIDDQFGAQRVKLPAGHLALYPASSLHHVEPVMRGVRTASFFWVQSMVRDDAARRTLFELDQTVQTLATDRGQDDDAVIRLTSIYHNLLRRWLIAESISMTNLKLRRAWFQVHKWIGLILAILIIPLALSGAALVFHDPVDRMLNPARYATSGNTLLMPNRYVDSVRAVLRPDERIASLQFPTRDGPVVVAVSHASGARHAGPPVRTMVYLDPPSARVLAVAASNVGAMRVIHMLHGSLLVPGVGRTIVGWIGIAMMVSCFTGLWLWWPTVGRWARGLRWRRHRNVDTNLHHLMGFWVALPLFVLSLTGAWIAFPGFFGALSGAPAAHGADRGARFRAAPVSRTVISADDAVRDAQTHAAGTAREIAWPSEADPRWTVTLASGADTAHDVTIADNGGLAVVTPTRPHGGPGLAGLMRRLHDGDDMGPVWRAIIFVTGILPALLAITGVVMWWRARRWRQAFAVKRRPAA